MTRVLYLSNTIHVLPVMRDAAEIADAAAVAIHLADNRTRLCTKDIRALLEKHPYVERTWRFTQQADGAIYVVSPEKHRYPQCLHDLDLLRRDLIAAGRDPDSFPVVFEVLRLEYDGPVATEEQLAKVLRWPWSDRFDSVTGPKVPKAKRPHDLPLKRLFEMLEQGPP